MSNEIFKGKHMILVTKEILRKTPPLYAQEEKHPDKIKVTAKFFTPTGPATWYMTELDPETGTAFGWCDLGMGCPELGYFNINELASIDLPLGLGIERDRHFTATLGEVMDGVRR